TYVCLVACLPRFHFASPRRLRRRALRQRAQAFARARQARSRVAGWWLAKWLRHGGSEFGVRSPAAVRSGSGHERERSVRRTRGFLPPYTRRSVDRFAGSRRSWSRATRLAA